MGKNEVVVFEDGELKIEVQVNPNEDTVWMTLNQIAELFERDKSAISRHISNIYKSAELDRGSTVAIFATVQNEGGRNIERRLEYYNLDLILSVGYRVNSKRGTVFRKWANSILKGYMLNRIFIPLLINTPNGCIIMLATNMNIREMRKKLGDTQSEFARRYSIPFRTIQNWESGARIPSEYVLNLLEEKVNSDLINRKTIKLPEYSESKLNLPRRNDFIGAFSWLKAVSECLGDAFVFALDQALMCDGSFLGRSDEYLVWVYGDDSLTRFNGVVVIGNNVPDRYIKEKNGIKYTNFNKTLNDSLANESILDTQGITEALSEYYYSNNDSFDGLYISDNYSDKFDRLASEAVEYYGD